ncbi:hypothetical protein FKM82_009173 [Ascaphus truei]
MIFQGPGFTSISEHVQNALFETFLLEAQGKVELYIKHKEALHSELEVNVTQFVHLREGWETKGSIHSRDEE